MRRPVLSTLSAPLCALLLASAGARAEGPLPAPAPAPAPAPSAPTPAAPAPQGHVPHPREVRPAADDVPSLEQIAHAFDPTPNGITSDEVVNKALQYSPELKKAELSEDTAKANKARATLAFAPRFDFSGRYTHLSYLKPSDDIAPEFQELAKKFQPVREQWAGQASVSLPVTDMFLTVIPTYKAAATLSDVATARVQASELQVAYDARIAFYNYAHVIGAVVIAQRSVEQLEANVRDLEALVQAGTVTETDLIRGRAELERMKVNVVEFTGQVDVALARLAIVTGTDMDSARGIGETFVGITTGATPDAAKLASFAKRIRPEAVALRKLQQAREYLATAKRGAQYPQLKGTWNGYYSNALPRVIPPKDEGRAAWDVGIALSYSPNDSIYAHTQYTDALTDLESVRQDLRLVEDGIDMEVAHAVSAHRTAVAATQAAIDSLTASWRYARDQRELMMAGAATPNDALVAQVLLSRAALEWVDSYIRVRIAEAALLKAEGKARSSTSTVARSTP
jgi:outer membrane protein TolC